VARQSAMPLKLSTNQRSDDCAWVKAAAAIISPPNDTLPEKYSGAATSVGAMTVTQPNPAVTQVRLVSPSTTRDVACSTAPRRPAALLVGLAAGQRDAVQVLVDAGQREAQFAFARVALGVARDQAVADPVGHERACDRIGDRGPQHEARHRVVAAVEEDAEVP